MKPGDGRLQVVVNPEPAHGVVDSGENLHGCLVRIVTGDFFIHLEEVAVARADDIFSEALNSVLEIQINAEAGWGNSAAFIADLLGRT